jgi:hypothetical protein
MRERPLAGAVQADPQAVPVSGERARRRRNAASQPARSRERGDPSFGARGEPVRERHSRVTQPCMSILTDFFVADELEIPSVLSDGPLGRLPTVETNGADPVKLATLNGIATGRDYSLEGGFDDLGEEIRFVSGDDEEGPWVYALPNVLVGALARADAERVAEIAEKWASTQEWLADGVPVEDLRPLVDDLAVLARQVKAPKRLYLWMSL